jgi:hypothetical protein
MMHYVSLILYIIQVQKNVDSINNNHMYNFLIDIIVERFPLFSYYLCIIIIHLLISIVLYFHPCSPDYLVHPKVFRIVFLCL